MFYLILSAFLFITPAHAYDQRVQDAEKKAKTFVEKLPFRLSFDAPDSNFGHGRSGRVGRPLRPNDGMDFSPNRQPWEMGRDRSYPGPMLRLTIPF